MVIAELTEVATGTIVFAEVRQFKKEDSILVLAKDFETAKLQQISLKWDGSKFTSLDNVYETTFEWNEDLETTKTTKIYKK
jgi:hypothetical protein